jgi:hypothetical protein
MVGAGGSLFDDVRSYDKGQPSPSCGKNKLIGGLGAEVALKTAPGISGQVSKNYSVVDRPLIFPN